MNRYEFENLISDYLDGSLPFNKIKEFEDYMNDNPDAVDLVQKIRNTKSLMSQLTRVRVSDMFNDKLLSRIKKERAVNGVSKKSFFGFTPFYASVLSCLCIALLIVTSQILNESGDSDLDSKPNEHMTFEEYHNLNEINNSEDTLAKSNLDSLRKSQNTKKPNNSKKIKFVNY